MKKIFLYNTGLVFSILFLFASCNDLDLAPTNRYTEFNFWESADRASAFLNRAYDEMYNSDYFFNTECLTDNLYQGRSASSEVLITSGQADASNGRFSGEWSACYTGINYCHTFLENVDRVPDMDETLKTRMKAEAKFIRASQFFRLATHFGDVPFFERLITSSEGKVISRSPKAEVIAFVRKELNEIVSILPTKQQYATADNGRITKGAAMMLLARTYLYENDYANVASICEKLMNGEFGQYSLFSSYEGLFLPENEYNSEVILDMGYAGSGLNTLKTWGNYTDAIPNTAGGRVTNFSPTQELVEDYIMLNGKGIKENGSDYDENDPYVGRDPRFHYTIVYHGYPWKKLDGTVITIYIKPGSSTGITGASNTDEYGLGNSTTTGYYLRKWYDPTSHPTSIASGLNLILMRYADVLLMYAEAKQELGQMNEDVWNRTIKLIRARAGFTQASALDYPAGSNLQTIIRRERRCELAIEGTRLFDIRRWKTIETVLNGNPHGAKFSSNNTQYIILNERKFNKDRDYLFAVPQSQIDINPNLLPQNPGYN